MVELEIVEVTDPTNALDIILRMIYPFPPPSFDGSLDTLVECLVIADKYDIKGAKLRLCGVLAQTDATQSLRVYAIATRFGFANLADSTSRYIISSVHLTGISKLPDDFNFVPATAYHKLIRHRANYLEAVVEVIEETPLRQTYCNCLAGKEVIRLRLAYLVTTGTPVEACVTACMKAYENEPRVVCQQDCVLNFIRSVISRVDKGLVKPEVLPPQKKRTTKRRA